MSTPHLSVVLLNRGQGWIRTTELRRGQIYSLLPLATWLLAHHITGEPPPLAGGSASWLMSFRRLRLHVSQRRDSNPRPADYKSAALPTELLWLVTHLAAEGSAMAGLPFPKPSTT